LLSRWHTKISRPGWAAVHSVFAVQLQPLPGPSSRSGLITGSSPIPSRTWKCFYSASSRLLGRDSEGTGFRGIHSKGLIDLIQMECLTQSSTVLRVTRGSLVGRIWIQAGELIDAEIEEHVGSPPFAAFWNGSRAVFENLPAEPGRERTISKSVNALLLETAQAIERDGFAKRGSIRRSARTAQGLCGVWRPSREPERIL